MVLETTEEIDLMDEGGILDDHRVRLGDRLTDANRAVVDAAERDDGRTGAFGAERRERLGLPSFEKRRDREQLCCRDDALAATPMNAHLEHAATVLGRHVLGIRADTVLVYVLARSGPLRCCDLDERHYLTQ